MLPFCCRSDLRGSGKLKLRLGMYASLLLASALMCILTIWEHDHAHH